MRPLNSAEFPKFDRPVCSYDLPYLLRRCTLADDVNALSGSLEESRRVGCLRSGGHYPRDLRLVDTSLFYDKYRKLPMRCFIRVKRSRRHGVIRLSADHHLVFTGVAETGKVKKVVSW